MYCCCRPSYLIAIIIHQVFRYYDQRETVFFAHLRLHSLCLQSKSFIQESCLWGGGRQTGHEHYVLIREDESHCPICVSQLSK